MFALCLYVLNILVCLIRPCGVNGYHNLFTADPHCQNRSPTCSGYSKSSCRHYWIKLNCAKYCGHCKSEWTSSSTYTMIACYFCSVLSSTVGSSHFCGLITQAIMRCHFIYHEYKYMRLYYVADNLYSYIYTFFAYCSFHRSLSEFFAITFFHFLLFLAETSMMSVKVSYVVRNESSARSDEKHRIFP